MEEKKKTEFEKLAGEVSDHSLGKEFFFLLKENGKWFLLPIIFIVLFLSGFMLLTSTGVAPFIYAIF